jgi:putative inorganic carbon (hco3(-)) transporter
MTAAPKLSQATAWQRRGPVLLAGALTLVAAVVAAAIVGNWPLLVVAALAAVLVICLIVSRLDLAVALLAAGFFFNDYLARGPGILTIDKGIGALAVAAWCLDWAVNRRPILTSRGLWLICGFLGWAGVSVVGAENYKAALVTSLRYLTFAILYFLVLQTVRGDRRRAEVLVRVVTSAAAVASIIGLAAFFGHHVTRASGPIGDPNDFGFILGSSMPLVIYQVRWAATRWGRALCALALVLILSCTVATFSRSALAGLAVASLWAVATGRIRLRWLLTAIAILAVVVAATLLIAPQVVQTALGEKAHVATANVDIRLGYYRVELSEWEHYPVTGVGPGNFVYHFYQFAPAASESLPFPSNVLTISGEEAYLVILAEQGAVGLALFLGYLAVSWADLRRRFPADQRTDQLQSAMAAGFIVACVGALFLAEQYYPPLWFLPALGASMASEVAPRAAGSSQPVTSRQVKYTTNAPAGNG